MFDLSIAGLRIQILRENPLLSAQIEKYRSEPDDSRPVDLVIDFDQDYLDAERQKEAASGLNFHPIYSEYLAIYRLLCSKILDFDGFLMHASVVEKDGFAYAFTAPSGTGKSTHARIWRENLTGVTPVNDDKPILRILDGKVYACGTPWCGKHNLSENRVVPLKGICILGRGEQNVIRPVNPADEIPSILTQIYRPKDAGLLSKTVDLLNIVLDKVPIWRLACNMEPEAAFVCYNAMSGNTTS
ncbi:MAG: hypothetical protein ACI3YK_02515 [Eubacteriales bacterium]